MRVGVGVALPNLLHCLMAAGAAQCPQAGENTLGPHLEFPLSLPFALEFPLISICVSNHPKLSQHVSFPQ